MLRESQGRENSFRSCAHDGDFVTHVVGPRFSLRLRLFDGSFILQQGSGILLPDPLPRAPGWAWKLHR